MPKFSNQAVSAAITSLPQCCNSYKETPLFFWTECVHWSSYMWELFALPAEYYTKKNSRRNPFRAHKNSSKSISLEIALPEPTARNKNRPILYHVSMAKKKRESRRDLGSYQKEEMMMHMIIMYDTYKIVTISIFIPPLNWKKASLSNLQNPMRRHSLPSGSRNSRELGLGSTVLRKKPKLGH